MTRNETLTIASGILLAIIAKALEFVVLPVRYRPDLLVVLAVAIGWGSGFWASLPAGFGLGLIDDLVFGRAPGSRAVSLAIASVSASTLRRFMNPDSILSKAVSALFSSAVSDVACFGMLRAMGVEVGLQYSFRTILPATVAWSVVLIVPVGGMVRRLSLLLGRLWPANEDVGREAAV